MRKYFKIYTSPDKISFAAHISSWESKGLSNEIIKPVTVSNRLRPKLSYHDAKISAEFNGNYLKQDKVTFRHGTTVNIYIVYELSSNLNDLDFALEDCLVQLN